MNRPVHDHVAIEDIPWDEIAFPTVKQTMELYLEDREKQDIKTRVFDIQYSDRLKKH